ncbi:MAG: aspartate aminotransferase family protein [Candidatus Margulisiibacteriota bacterium]|jgi:4-aminobutyrate aminotransferase
MKELVKRADQVLSPVLGHYSQLEVAFGKGCYLYDYNNEPYLDFATGIGSAVTGHCHTDVVNAIKTQAETLIHACAGVVYYEPNIALAEQLGGILGAGLTSVFFTQSGTEAVEAAIKLAKFTFGKQGILAFKGAFHGRSLGSLSITTSKIKYQEGYLPLLPNTYFFDYPYCYRCPWQKENHTCELFCLKNLELQLSKLSAELAAVIIEPILGEGGYVPLPKQFLTGLKALTKKYGILLILDEVQTGFAKTGEWFCFQKENIEPDIICLAKGIASGLPLGACIAKPELMAKWKTGAHGSTYSGNPVCCQASLATIKVLENVLPNIKKLNEIAEKILYDELTDYPFLGDLRIQGLMIGLEFVKDKSTKEPYPELVKSIMTKCLENKLIVISSGLFDNVIRLMPPLIINEADLKKGLMILVKVIKNSNGN